MKLSRLAPAEPADATSNRHLPPALEQSVTAYAYHETPNSEPARVTAHRWDGTGASTRNIMLWMAANDIDVQERQFMPNSLGDGHVRYLQVGKRARVQVGDWVAIGDWSGATAEDRLAWWTDEGFRESHTFPWVEREVAKPEEGLAISVEELQRRQMREIIERRGDRGALRLYLEVAAELDLERC